jgi:hypothetical protein
MASKSNSTRVTNTGKPSEEIFTETLESKGAVVFRLRDKADLYGLNKKNVAAFGQPCDFLVVHPTTAFLAEVKSSNNPTSFPLSCFTAAQKAAMARCHSKHAGGKYKIFIHNLCTDKWYKMDASSYVIAVHEGVKSIKWDSLKPITIWL